MALGHSGRHNAVCREQRSLHDGASNASTFSRDQQWRGTYAVPRTKHSSADAVRRIGFVTGFSRTDAEAILKALRRELERFGWWDGRNREPRAADGINQFAMENFW